MLLGRRAASAEGLADGGPGVGPWWLQPWTFFDGRWYLKVAGPGYEYYTSVFYPLYPSILRLAGSNPVHQAMLGIVVSTSCFTIAVGILARLVEFEHGRVAAKAAAVVIAFLPFSAVWGAVYTESLALLLLVGCWWSARRQRWDRVAALGLLAGLSRNVGLVLSLALVVELWQQTGETTANNRREQFKMFLGAGGLGRWSAIGRLAACGVPGLVSAIFMLWARTAFGDAGGLAAQRTFARALAWPWWAVWKDLASFTTYVTVGKLLSLLALVVAFASTVLHRNRLRWGEHLLLWGVLALHLLYARQKDPYTIGAARYVMAAFPFSVGIGIVASRIGRRWQIPIGAVMVLLCALGAYTIGEARFEIG